MRVPTFGTVTIYRGSNPPQQVVLFVSGDGGWNLGVVDMAQRLRDAGALVVGIDIRQFIKGLEASGSCAYPAGALEELSRAVQLRFKLPAYKRPILVGYSSGATLVYARAGGGAARNVRGRDQSRLLPRSGNPEATLSDAWPQSRAEAEGIRLRSVAISRIFCSVDGLAGRGRSGVRPGDHTAVRGGDRRVAGLRVTARRPRVWRAGAMDAAVSRSLPHDRQQLAGEAGPARHGTGGRGLVPRRSPSSESCPMGLCWLSCSAAMVAGPRSTGASQPAFPPLVSRSSAGAAWITTGVPAPPSVPPRIWPGSLSTTRRRGRRAVC